MSRFVALRLRKLPVIQWYLDSSGCELTERGDVVVRSQHGLEIANVLRFGKEGKSVDLPHDPMVKEILRPIDPKDRETMKEVTAKETEAFVKTREFITLHKLNMKLLKTEYLFDFSRLIIYYKAESKVDFRELLKTLAGHFRTRIELRQIGVRDETKLLGGIGCCGKMVCCAQFMGNFHPVSTKMAKDQNLSMNPAKLSGICMRLLCCLAHEHEYYASFHGKFPKIGAEIVVATEKARVMDLNYLTQKAFLGFPDRRKMSVKLELIKGRKDPPTSRNLWWVQEPGKPEPDLSILLQPAAVLAPRDADSGNEKVPKHSGGRSPRGSSENKNRAPVEPVSPSEETLLDGDVPADETDLKIDEKVGAE